MVCFFPFQPSQALSASLTTLSGKSIVCPSESRISVGTHSLGHQTNPGMLYVHCLSLIGSRYLDNFLLDNCYLLSVTMEGVKGSGNASQISRSTLLHKVINFFRVFWLSLSSINIAGHLLPSNFRELGI